MHDLHIEKRWEKAGAVRLYIECRCCAMIRCEIINHVTDEESSRIILPMTRRMMLERSISEAKLAIAGGVATKGAGAGEL